MKCDELKSFNCVDSDLQEFCEPRLVYPKSEVDAAIAELKEFAEDACLERDDNSRVIDELESENRKLKRALWLARAERALTEAERYRTLEVGWKMFRGDYETAKEYSNLATKWDNVEQLCKSKAKEYK